MEDEKQPEQMQPEYKQPERPRSYTPLALAILAFVIFAMLVLGQYFDHKNDKPVIVTTIQSLGPCKNTIECDTTCKNTHPDGFGICDVTSVCICRYQMKESPSPPKPRCVADISEGCNKTCQNDCCSDKCAHQYPDGRGFCSNNEPVYEVALCSCDYLC